LKTVEEKEGERVPVDGTRFVKDPLVVAVFDELELRSGKTNLILKLSS